MIPCGAFFYPMQRLCKIYVFSLWERGFFLAYGGGICYNTDKDGLFFQKPYCKGSRRVIFCLMRMFL